MATLKTYFKVTFFVSVDCGALVYLCEYSNVIFIIFYIVIPVMFTRVE